MSEVTNPPYATAASRLGLVQQTPGHGPTIDSLYYYPIKGLSPQRLDAASLAAGHGFAHDRTYALARADGRYVPGDRQALGKREFHVLMREPALAGVRSEYFPDTDTVELRSIPGVDTALPATGHDGGALLRADLSTAAGRGELTACIATLLGLPADRQPVFAEEPGRRFPDLLRSDDPADMQAVSIINLASIRELARAAGTEVDPLRFRANIYIDGLEPFAERDLLGSTLEAGGIQLEVFKEIGRCTATEVNLESARRDVPVLKTLQEAFGHTNMGIYAHVRTGGTLVPGTAVVLPG
ncbi:MOSC domain-containing protein [Arthrobacter rhombi]